ncbi:MAG: hypothetical protein ACRYGI_09240 [Janthinobacterium lividum]
MLRPDTRVGQATPFNRFPRCSDGLTKTLDTISIRVAPKHSAATAASPILAAGT